MIDLHVHSSHSDGVLKPDELLRYAQRSGLALMALADHDCVSGIDEAMSCGVACGIRVIPAVELSVAYERYQDVHLLGFGIDHHDLQFQERLRVFCNRRDHRNEEIVNRINRKLLNQGKTPISLAEVTALADGAIGRPHIARVLMEQGHVASMEEAFSLYLVPCNVPKEYFPLEEALAEIHRVGGLAVLAHPPSITNDLAHLSTVIRRLTAMGLDGIEAYSSMATELVTAELAALAKKESLLVTGGSDFHGISANEELGMIKGSGPIPAHLGEALLRALTKRHGQ